MTRSRRVAALGLLACLAAAGRAAAQSQYDPWRQIWGYGQDPLRAKYQELFDEPFPARPYDLFHRGHPFYEVQQFNRAFDLRTAGVSWQVDESQKGLTLSVYWPGSAEKTLDVKIAHGLVRVLPSPRTSYHNGPYRFYAAESRAIEVPVPNEADASSARVTRAGDLIRVDFDKREGLAPLVLESVGPPSGE